MNPTSSGTRAGAAPCAAVARADAPPLGLADAAVRRRLRAALDANWLLQLWLEIRLRGAPAPRVRAVSDHDMSLATSTPGPSSALRHRQPRLTEAPQRMNASIRVVLGSHDPLSRAGITDVLREAGIDVVASGRDAADLVRKVRAYHPDLAVMDLDMEPSHSDPDHTEAVRTLRSVRPSGGSSDPVAARRRAVRPSGCGRPAGRVRIPCEGPHRRR